MTTNQVYVVSDCYGDRKNLTLVCSYGQAIKTRLVRVGITQQHNCPIISGALISQNCCRPICSDCILSDHVIRETVERTCDGRNLCSTKTEWVKAGVGEASKCLGKLTNYMMVAYECKNKPDGNIHLNDRSELTTQTVCENIQNSEQTPGAFSMKSLFQTSFFLDTDISNIPSRSSKFRDIRTTSVKSNNTKASNSNITSPFSTTPSTDYRESHKFRSDLAKTDALIFGSTAAAALFILAIGVIIGWLYCRRRHSEKQQTRSPFFSNNMAMPIYAYDDTPGYCYHSCSLNPTIWNCSEGSSFGPVLLSRHSLIDDGSVNPYSSVKLSTVGYGLSRDDRSANVNINSVRTMKPNILTTELRSHVDGHKTSASKTNPEPLPRRTSRASEFTDGSTRSCSHA